MPAPRDRDDLEATRGRQWRDLHDLVAAYARRDPVQQVAVVGNAPIPPDEQRARVIDGADLVIRANSMMLDGPGDPPRFGTACDVVILSQATALTPWALHDYHRRLYLVPQAGWVVHRETYKLPGDPPFWPRDLGAVPLPNAVVKRRLVAQLAPDARPGSIIPTSGLIGLFLGRDLFPDAEVVGTGFSMLDDTTQTSWQHASGGSTKVNWQHDLDREAALIRSWTAAGNLRITS